MPVYRALRAFPVSKGFRLYDQEGVALVGFVSKGQEVFCPHLITDERLKRLLAETDPEAQKPETENPPEAEPSEIKPEPQEPAIEEPEVSSGGNTPPETQDASEVAPVAPGDEPKKKRSK